LGVFKTLSQAHNADVTLFLKALVPAEEIAFEIEEFFQPAGFFTEMLRFDKKNQQNFSEISLQLVKS
jgi:hypothetical protein